LSTYREKVKVSRGAQEVGSGASVNEEGGGKKKRKNQNKSKSPTTKPQKTGAAGSSSTKKRSRPQSFNSFNAQVNKKLNKHLNVVMDNWQAGTCHTCKHLKSDQVYPLRFALETCNSQLYTNFKQLTPVLAVVPSCIKDDFEWECAVDEGGLVIAGVFVDNEGKSYSSLANLVKVL
jgi:hypothetical protein